MTVPNLKQTHPDSAKAKINWAKMEEADNFAKTVKLYRQGKVDDDMFRRFRLQHGAYGTRMTGNYAMVRIKIPAGEVYPYAAPTGDRSAKQDCDKMGASMIVHSTLHRSFASIR